jgi:hypothetical protein
MEQIIEFLKTQGIEWQGTSQMAESITAMGEGMLGIFIVIAIIVGVTVTLNNVTATKKDDKDDE